VPKWKFIFNLWNLLDLTIIGLFAYEAKLVHDHVFYVNPELDKLRQVKDVYHEVYWLAAYQKHEGLIMGIVVLASWIKVGYIAPLYSTRTFFPEFYRPMCG